MPAAPFGAAKIVFAFWELKAIAIVPADVIGDPVTLKIDGAVSATDVTVPLVRV